MRRRLRAALPVPRPAPSAPAVSATDRAQHAQPEKQPSQSSSRRERRRPRANGQQPASRAGGVKPGRPASDAGSPPGTCSGVSQRASRASSAHGRVPPTRGTGVAGRRCLRHGSPSSRSSTPSSAAQHRRAARYHGLVARDTKRLACGLRPAWPSDPDRADRLVGAAAVRAGDAGDRDGELGLGVRERAERHLDDGLGADGAVRGQRRRLRPATALWRRSNR